MYGRIPSNVVGLLPRVTVIAGGYWADGPFLFVAAWLIGAMVPLYLIAYVVHRPHEATGRTDLQVDV